MNQTREITGRTVLIGMLCFFGVIFAVNGLFVYFALGSWPGLSFDNAYRRGLEYNTVLEAAEQQSQLGWQSQVVLGVNGEGDRVLEVEVSDRTGQPIRLLDVHVDLRRPTHAGDDISIRAEERRAGRYSLNIGASRLGLWQVQVRANSTAGDTYAMTHEVEILR